MAHKTLIDGTAYEISGGKTLVNGTAYTIESGKTLVDGTAYKVGFSTGTPISNVPVGKKISFEVAGVSREFIVVHQGKPSERYHDSCNGTWLMMKNCLYKTPFSGGSNSYSNSLLHNYLSNKFPGDLDYDVSKEIKQVYIPYGSSSGIDVGCFLLSARELGDSRAGIPNDGATLAYFNTTVNERLVDRHSADVDNKVYQDWWTRSPHPTDSTMEWVWDTDQNQINALYCNRYGLTAYTRPAFILPPDFDITGYTITD